MEKTKLTKRDYFKMLAEVVAESGKENQAELQAFINHEVELLDKKSASRGTATTAKQKENEDLKEYILGVLTEINKAVTITELQAEDVRLGELTNQRISAMLKQLKDENKVIRAELKKKAYFKIAE
jgi:hypothetical protein